MAIDVIDTWLKGNKSYTVGKVLLKQFNPTDPLLKLLNQPENPVLKSKLIAALKAISSTPILAVKLPKESTTELPPTTNITLTAINKEWKDLYVQMQHIRRSMIDMGTSNEPAIVSVREQYAFKVLELEKQINAVWEKRDYYVDNGTLPFAKATPNFEIPSCPIALGALVENLKRYIRKYGKAYRDNPANSSAAQLYEQYQQQLEAVYAASKNK